MKILLAVDGSPFTAKAADYLLSHMNWFQGEPELHLLHVKAPIPVGRARAVLGHDEVEQYYREESAAVLDPVEKLFTDKSIRTRSGYRTGEIDDEIRAYVAENAIDLIVMGSHGHGALKNLVMGSTATKVLAGTSVPVLLVR